VIVPLWWLTSRAAGKSKLDVESRAERRGRHEPWLEAAVTWISTSGGRPDSSRTRSASWFVDMTTLTRTPTRGGRGCVTGPRQRQAASVDVTSRPQQGRTQRCAKGSRASRRPFRASTKNRCTPSRPCRGDRSLVRGQKASRSSECNGRTVWACQASDHRRVSRPHASVWRLTTERSLTGASPELSAAAELDRRGEARRLRQRGRTVATSSRATCSNDASSDEPAPHSSAL
jgi:hypothetical protein